MCALDPIRRSENMRRIRSKDTKPEKALRSLLHRAGYRFRIHANDLPGSPDIVFPARRKVVFVHGCFWHQHSRCGAGIVPASRREYWVPKLKRNQDRDRSARLALARIGWKSLTVWECEIEKNPAATLRRSMAFLDQTAGFPALEMWACSPRTTRSAQNVVKPPHLCKTRPQPSNQTRSKTPRHGR